jgi:hypothetical protein
MLKRVALLFIAISFSAVQADAPSYAYSTDPHSALQKKSSPAKENALQWKHIESVFYSNTASGGETPVWVPKAHDTLIYDVSGNCVVTMSSLAQSGWASDSLKTIDSTIWQNGKSIDAIHLAYSPPGLNNAISYGNRWMNREYDQGKIHVSVSMSWSNFEKNWIGTGKDSSIYSEPVLSSSSDRSIFIGEYVFAWDTSKDSWKIESSELKNAAECDSITYVAFRQDRDPWGGRLVNSKSVLRYKTSVWNLDNRSSETIQREDTSSHSYSDSLKSNFTKDAAGNSITVTQVFENGKWINRDSSCEFKKVNDRNTGQATYFWDRTKSDWKGTYCSHISRGVNGWDNIDTEYVWNDMNTIWIPIRILVNIYNDQGHTTGLSSSDWDSTRSAWITSSQYTAILDSKGRDSLTTQLTKQWNAEQSVWDTTRYRTATAYDTSGGIAGVIYSNWGSNTGGIWHEYSKAVYRYAYINASTPFIAQPSASRRKIVVLKTPRAIQFAGPDISGCKIFNMAGRCVMEIRQQASSSLRFDISRGNSCFVNGTYIVALVAQGGTSTFRVPIIR